MEKVYKTPEYIRKNALNHYHKNREEIIAKLRIRDQEPEQREKNRLRAIQNRIKKKNNKIELEKEHLALQIKLIELRDELFDTQKTMCNILNNSPELLKPTVGCL
jgi:hypothetical protein